jgi:hypothetical protein
MILCVLFLLFEEGHIFHHRKPNDRRKGKGYLLFYDAGGKEPSFVFQLCRTLTCRPTAEAINSVKGQLKMRERDPMQDVL